MVPDPALAKTMPRKILALWHSRDKDSDRDYSSSLIHRKLEMVFNHFGFNLEYHDLHHGPPTENLDDDFAGIVSWLSLEAIKNPDSYAKWLREQLDRRKKLLIIGDFGFSRALNESDEKLPRVNGILARLGIDASGSFFDNPLLARVEGSPDSALVEFERELKHEIPSYRVVRNKDPKNKVWLTVSSGTKESRSDVVILGKQGGYVQGEFALFSHPQEGKTSWRINPFGLVKEIFLPDLTPIPDTTTMNGRRLFFSHIDGDGLMNLSYIDRKRFSSEIIRDEILKRYPLPVTVSVITMETDPDWELPGARQFAQIAREIFSLPNVEPASHTFSHPLSWEKDPSAEEIKNYLGEKSTHKGPILSYEKAGKVLDYERETVTSLDHVNEKLSGKKKAELLLWSGSCRPPAEALAGLERRGFVNMNGGDSRMDKTFNSVGHLSRLYRRPGGRLQVYAAAPNENIYTNLWSPPYAGFDQVIETFENTESPRRLKPVNIYYHFYSGEYQASLKALQKAYDWAMEKKLHPIKASLYPKIVQGFLSARISQTSPRGFSINKAGELRTLRFETKNLFPDYERSKNVVGHKIHQGSLYVFLGPGESAHIELTNSTPKGIYIEYSNARIEELRVDGKKIIYHFRGEVPVEATLVVNGKRRRFRSSQKYSVLTLEQM